METKKKKFDCVEMKHQGAAKVQKQIRNLTQEQELEYWARGTEYLIEKQKQLKVARRNHPRKSSISGSEKKAAI